MLICDDAGGRVGGKQGGEGHGTPLWGLPVCRTSCSSEAKFILSG